MAFPNFTFPLCHSLDNIQRLINKMTFGLVTQKYIVYIYVVVGVTNLLLYAELVKGQEMKKDGERVKGERLECVYVSSHVMAKFLIEGC